MTIERELMGSGLGTGSTHAVLGLSERLAAAGTIQTNAALITRTNTYFTTVASGAGGRLPTGAMADTIWVTNLGANALLVYPPVGGAISGGSTNAAVSLAVNATTVFQCTDPVNGLNYNQIAASVASGVTSVNGSTGVVTLAASDFQGTGLTVSSAGFRGIPQNAQTGNYTTVAADAGKHLFHASGAGASDTYTIDSNANVAYEIGTAITFINMDSNALNIAITSDTMNLAGAGTTGTRSLAQYGVATAVKVTATVWIISGTNLS